LRENIAHPFASRCHIQQGPRVGNCRTVAARNKGQARCPAASSSCAFQTVARGSFVGVSCVLASRRNLSCRPRRFFGFLRIPDASSCLPDFRLRNLTEHPADQSLYEKRILPNCLWGGWLGVSGAGVAVAKIRNVIRRSIGLFVLTQMATGTGQMPTDIPYIVFFKYA